MYAAVIIIIAVAMVRIVLYAFRSIGIIIVFIDELSWYSLKLSESDGTGAICHKTYKTPTKLTTTSETMPMTHVSRYPFEFCVLTFS